MNGSTVVQIEGYPMMILFENGKQRRIYNGHHRLESLDGFLAEYTKHVEL